MLEAADNPITLKIVRKRLGGTTRWAVHYASKAGGACALIDRAFDIEDSVPDTAEILGMQAAYKRGFASEADAKAELVRITNELTTRGYPVQEG